MYALDYSSCVAQTCKTNYISYNFFTEDDCNMANLLILFDVHELGPLSEEIKFFVGC